MRRHPGEIMAEENQSREPRGMGHRQVIVKIVISLLGFMGALGLSELLPEVQKPGFLWNLGASLFFAGIVFIAQYLVEVEKRLDRVAASLDDHVSRSASQFSEHAAATEKLMRDGFSRIHLASELFGLRDATQLKPEEFTQMTKLVRNSSKIEGASPLVQEFAHSEIARLADYLKQLGDGSDLTYEGEDRDWLLGLTRAARKSIRATSLSTVDAGRSFVDGGLWTADLGQRYLDAQREAIRRGVGVQRIFILTRKDLSASTQDLDQILEMHLRIGVEVRILDAMTHPTMNPRLRDFIVFDEVLSYQSTPASTGSTDIPIIVNTALVTDEKRVGERRREFEDLWEAAIPRTRKVPAPRSVDHH